MKRFFSGLVLVVLVISVTLYAPSPWLALAVSIVIVAALKEFYGVFFADADRSWNIFSLSLAGVSPFVFLAGETATAYLRQGQAATAYAVFIVFVFFLGRLFGGETKGSFQWTSGRVLSVLYVAFPLSHLVLFDSFHDGRQWILFLFTVVWANDTFAYLGGTLFGSRKLTSVSPGKTVEGAASGIIFGVLGAYIYERFLPLGITGLEAVVAGFSLGLVATAGDLFESLLKRDAGIKDFGSVIPGHGGVLDRVDSVIFSAPVLYYYVLWKNAML